MNINPQDLADRLSENSGDLIKTIVAAIEACAQENRAASVSLLFKIARDPDSPHVVALTSAIKTKTPKGPRTDIVRSTEPEEVQRWKTGEDQGQQTIEDHA
jgi:hypothetical protein